MLISPPFLPQTIVSNDVADDDPMMTAAEKLESGYHGCFPVTFDRRWHCGIHLVPDYTNEPIRAIADGEVVAYRISQQPISDGDKDENDREIPNTNTGFVLLRHVTETGDGRTIKFYSLYLHLLDLTAQRELVSPQDTSMLANWLLEPSEGVALGAGKKVRRKDILGYFGQSQGLRHLHFEVFMSEADFDDWFKQSGSEVQLGEENPVQPTSSDWWGHAYFVIPASVEFVSRPTMPCDNTWFPKLNSGKLPQEKSKLYVEVYFHRGQRFMRSWLDKDGDGRRVLLTSQAVMDVYRDYEYKLYERSMALYPKCPSDGYELLRFGRILSPAPTLVSAQEIATWVAVPFDENGTLGYVNVGLESILKLSDADFPIFTGWKKIDFANAPLDSNGLFSYRKVCRILDEIPDRTADSSQTDPAVLNEQLARYVQGSRDTRLDLTRFVCHAKSEWDPENNDERYRDLKAPDGYFGKREAEDPRGYERFIEFLRRLQFLGKIPALSDKKKFWFFHPLSFIRHFRKCGWMSSNEFQQIYSNDHYSRTQQPSPDQLRNLYLKPINLATRKYGLTSPTRLAHFLGQGAVESGWLTLMQEASMLGKHDEQGVHGKSVNLASKVSEMQLGHWYGQLKSEDDAWYRSTKFNSHGARIAGSYDWRNGNCDFEDSQKFRGRGFKQLTGRSNYADYWIFRGWIAADDFSRGWWNDAAFSAHNRSAMKRIPATIVDPQKVAFPENCIDSGGFYLRCARPNVARQIDGDSESAASSEAEKAKERELSRSVTYAINGGYIDDARRLEYTRLVKKIIS